jgi:peptidoglycan hydrolase-like protein with peptidoglycan-binding domain
MQLGGDHREPALAADERLSDRSWIVRALLVIAIWLAITAASPISPDSSTSANWFASLSSDLQFRVQANLILTRDYDGLVDGRFGPRTFMGIKQYQSRHGDVQDGVLTSGALETLSREAGRVLSELGMTQVQDSSSGLSLFVPSAILTRHSESTTGTVYSTPDGAMTLSLKSYRRFNEPLESFVRKIVQVQAEGRTVTYSTVGADYVVVTGAFPDHSFYTFYLQAHGDLIGFTLNWTKQYSDTGAITASLGASYAQAIADLQQPAAGSELIASEPPNPAPTSGPQPTEAALEVQAGTFVVPVLINDAITLEVHGR